MGLTTEYQVVQLAIVSVSTSQFWSNLDPLNWAELLLLGLAFLLPGS